jgi:hypothetical protein
MKRLLPLFILFFAVIVLFRPFIFQGKLPIPADTIVGLYHPFRDLYAPEYPRGVPFKNFLITDPVRQQYPWRWMAVEIEKTGNLPLWNPYTMAGTPLLSTLQGAVFYPFNIFLFILPFSVGWSILILLQPILAGIFLYFYLNNLKFKPLASLLGAITYIFSGFSIAWMEWGTVLHTALWLPLALLSIDKLFLHFGKSQISNFPSLSSGQDKFLISNSRISWSLVFVFSLVAALFAGHLQTFFYLYLVTIAYFIARWWQLHKQRKFLFLFFLLNFCFLLLTFIQWYPTLQFILSSARDIDQVNWQQEGWFIPWQHLVQFIAPDFFGNPTTLNYWGVWNYAEFVGYVGIFPLLTALFALFYRRDKKTAFFGMVLSVSLLFSLPTIIAQLPFLFHIPFLSTSQPTRLLFLVDFSLAFLAAAGFDLLIRHKTNKIILPTVVIILFFVLSWLFVLLGGKFFPIPSEHLFTAKRNLYFPTSILFSLLGIIILLIFVRKIDIRKGLFVVLIGITLFDLLRFSQKFIPFVQKEYLFPETQSLSFLQKDQSLFRIMSTQSEIMPPNFTVMYGLQSLEGYDPLYLRRYGELMAAIGRGRPDISGPFGFNRIITPHNPDSRLIDLLGVKYILSLNEMHSDKLEEVFSEGQTKIYNNKQAFPRAFFVTSIKTATDKQEAIKSLFNKQINFHDTAVVERWDNTKLLFGNGSIAINEYSANRIILQTLGDEESFLVFMDTYYPTWHATVDGNETKIYITNYTFRGIVIPAGKHTVIFTNRLL